MGNLDVIEDRESIQPMSMDFDPLPAGRYQAMITASEVAVTKSGGLMLKLTWIITAVGYEGRKVFGNLNIRNASEKAQQIGRGQLASLAKACGKVGIPEDSMDLHDIEHVIKLAVEESPGYPAKNVVKGFYPKSGTVEIKEAPKKIGNLEPVEAKDDELPF